MQLIFLHKLPAGNADVGLLPHGHSKFSVQPQTFGLWVLILNFREINGNVQCNGDS